MSIIVVQEHWLTENELNKFSLINSDFSFYAASGMNDAVSQGLLVGRPFRAVGFLWRRSLDSCIQFIAKDENGCLYRN